jgi:hypothetical protein
MKTQEEMLALKKETLTVYKYFLSEMAERHQVPKHTIEQIVYDDIYMRTAK